MYLLWKCFPCVEDFDVVMFGSGFDRVGLHLDILHFLYDVMCLQGFTDCVCIFCI